MTNRAGAWSMGATRTGLGVACLLAPRLIATGWVGPEATAELPMDRVVRALGVRELILGGGMMACMTRNRPVRGWLLAGMVADLADAVATAALRSRLPKDKAAMVVAAALGSAATGAHLAYHLNR